MKFDDLITEAPMGMLNKLWTKTKSLVPGEIGSRASGEYDVGRVANQWKKDYVNLLGKMGQKGYGDTKTFISFLKNLGFTHNQIKKVLKIQFAESAQIYEAMLTSKMADTLIMRAAKVAAMAAAGVDRPLGKEPNPTAPRQPGAIDTAVDIGKKVAPQVGKVAKTVGTQIANKFSRQAPVQKQRVEPTMGTPVPRNMPSLTPQQSPVVPNKKFEPNRKAPKMKTKPVTKYK